MRDSGLLLREFQAPCLEELADNGCDFGFEQLFRTASHDKVICISNHMDLDRAVTCFGESLSKDLFNRRESGWRQRVR